jgi:hypothetical protein
MKGIDSTGAPLVHVPGWMGGCVEVKAVLWIASAIKNVIIILFVNTHYKSPWKGSPSKVLF